LTWSGDSSSPAPTPETAPAAAPADATALPAAPDPAVGQPQQGEPPKERWDAILANARQKAADEAMAPYQWAKQINPQEFASIQQLARTLQSDPVAGLQQLIGEIRKDPKYDAQLKSLAARQLSQRSTPPAPSLQPIQVQLDNGQQVGLYSSEQIAAMFDQRLASVQEDMTPLKQALETAKAERAAAEQQHQVQQFVTTTYDDLKTWPGMDKPENQQMIAQALSQAPIDPNDPREVALALNAVYRKHVLPTLNQAAESKLLDSLKTKAAASTSVNPGSSAPSTSRAVTRFDQLGAEAWR
jgi:hypothetical protein